MASKQRPLKGTSVRGVLETKGADGVVRYFARYVDVDGKRKLRLLAVGSIVEAKNKFTELKAGVLKRREVARAHAAVGLADPAAEVAAKVERAKLTVGELAKKFWTGYTRPRLKDVARYRADAQSTLETRVLPALGAMSAVAVTSKDIDRLRDKLADEGYAPASIKHAYAAISRMYVWGKQHGLVPCGSPTEGSEPPEVENGRLDFLSADEVEKLLEETRQAGATHVLVAIGVYAGLRKSEMFALRWVDVNLDRSLLHVAESKNGQARNLPINAELAVILRAWKERCPASSLGLVIPVDGAQGDKYEMLGLPEAMAAAIGRVPSMPTHLLRHTFASHAAMSGMGLLTLQRLLGHKTLEMTLRYSHLSPDHMHAEVARMTFRRPLADVVDIEARRREQTASEAATG